MLQIILIFLMSHLRERMVQYNVGLCENTRGPKGVFTRRRGSRAAASRQQRCCRATTAGAFTRGGVCRASSKRLQQQGWGLPRKPSGLVQQVALSRVAARQNGYRDVLTRGLATVARLVAAVARPRVTV